MLSGGRDGICPRVAPAPPTAGIIASSVYMAGGVSPTFNQEAGSGPEIGPRRLDRAVGRGTFCCVSRRNSICMSWRSSCEHPRSGEDRAIWRRAVHRCPHRAIDRRTGDLRRDASVRRLGLLSVSAVRRSYAAVRQHWKATAFMAKGEDCPPAILDFIVDNYMPVLEQIEDESRRSRTRCCCDDDPDIERLHCAATSCACAMRRAAGEVCRRLTSADLPQIHTAMHLFRDVTDHIHRQEKSIACVRCWRSPSRRALVGQSRETAISSARLMGSHSGADSLRRHLRHELQRHAGTKMEYGYPIVLTAASAHFSTGGSKNGGCEKRIVNSKNGCSPSQIPSYSICYSLFAIRYSLSGVSAPGRLEGHAGVILAVGAGFGGLVAAEVEVFRQRVAVRPFAGALGQFDELQMP